jgi:Fic family protein
MEEIAKAMGLKAELDAMRPINAEQEARIMQKFRLDWNYHSNHLEGNSLTFGETKTLLLYGITAQGKPLKDHIEMTGHNEALNWVLDIVKGERVLTETFVRELHELLLKEPYEVDAITPDGKPTKRMISVGKYKSVPNHVKTQTGEIHYFATPEETPAKMEELVNWYREQLEREDANPIFIAALFHHRFINIHPFDDGNGRTGRLLMNFILMKFGFPPAIIKTEDKLNYYRALQQADGGAVDVFVEYIAKNLVRSLEIMLAGARGENIEEPDDLDKELALLQQQLKGMGRRAEVLKSKESILKVSENSIWPFGQAMVDVLGKFDKFFVRGECKIRASNSPDFNLKEDSVLSFLETINDSMYDIELYYSLIAFRQIGMGEFHLHTRFKFSFGATTYLLYQDDKLKIEKPYDEFLNKFEIEKVVGEEAKKYLGLIKKKIGEADNIS